MDFKVTKIKGYNCPSKYLLIINNTPVVFANSNPRISKMIQYVEGYISEDEFKDKSIIKELNKYRKEVE